MNKLECINAALLTLQQQKNIGEYLRETGIVAEGYSAWNCPIHHFLKRCVGDSLLIVGLDRIVVDIGGKVEEIKLSSKLKDFIREVNRNRHDYLIEGHNVP